MNRKSELESRNWKTRNGKPKTPNWLTVCVTDRRALLGAFAALVFTIAGCSHPQGDFTPVRLSSDLEPLRTDFNRDAGQIRLVMLVDPT
jgi:hypothetical protein